MSRRAAVPRDHELLGVIDTIYAAGIDSDGWTPLLARLVAITRSSVGGLVHHGLRTHEALVRGLVGADDTYRRVYELQWAPHNIYLHASAAQVRSGAVRLSHELVPLRDALRSDYVNDFLLPAGVLHIMGAVLHVEEESAVMLHLMRSPTTERFDAGDRRVMDVLMPHLQRAAAIRRRLGEIDLHHRAALEGLDGLTTGVLVLDEHGALLFANRSGEDILGAHDGLVLVDGRPRAADARGSAALARAVVAACRRDRDHAEAGGALLVSRPSGKRSFVVMVAPLTREIAGPWSRRPAAIVFVTDPHAVTPQGDAILRHLYGLTPAEARVALLLVDGCGIETLAERLEVTVNTARTHVKRLLAKTDARTQRELLRALIAATHASPRAQ